MHHHRSRTSWIRFLWQGIVLLFDVSLALTIIGRSFLLHFPEWNFKLFQPYAVTVLDIAVSNIWTLMCVRSMMCISEIAYIIRYHEPLPLNCSYRKIILLVGTFAYFITVNWYVYQSWTSSLDKDYQIFQLLPASFIVVHGFVQIIFVRPQDLDIDTFTRVSNIAFNVVMLIHLTMCVVDGVQSHGQSLSVAFIVTSPFEFFHRLMAMVIFWWNPNAFLENIADFFQNLLQRIIPGNNQDNDRNDHVNEVASPVSTGEAELVTKFAFDMKPADFVKNKSKTICDRRRLSFRRRPLYHSMLILTVETVNNRLYPRRSELVTYSCHDDQDTFYTKPKQTQG